MDEQKKSCLLDGKEHSHGEELCVADKCMQCKDGKWEYTKDFEEGCA